MIDILRNGMVEYAIHDRHESDHDNHVVRVQFHHRDTARAFLRHCCDDYNNRLVIRNLLARDATIARLSSMSHHDVVEQIAQRFVSGALWVEELPREFPGWVRGGADSAAEETAEQPVADAPVETHWIDFCVIDDASEQPVGGVTLKIKLPNGETREFQSRPDGMIMIKGLDAGTCDILQMRDPKSFEVVKVE